MYTFCLLFVHQSTHANNTQTYTSFPDMSEIEQFKYILSSNDLDICKICILGHRYLWTGHSIPHFYTLPPIFHFFFHSSHGNEKKIEKRGVGCKKGDAVSCPQAPMFWV